MLFFHRVCKNTNFLQNKIRSYNSVLEIESPNQSLVIDHNVVYFIDVSISLFFICSHILYEIKKSYIHPRAFILTIGRDRNSIIKTISRFQIRHCFLFQQSSHLVS